MLLTAPQVSAGPENKERKILTENVSSPGVQTLFLILVSNDICEFCFLFVFLPFLRFSFEFSCPAPPPPICVPCAPSIPSPTPTRWGAWSAGLALARPPGARPLSSLGRDRLSHSGAMPAPVPVLERPPCQPPPRPPPLRPSCVLHAENLA